MKVHPVPRKRNITLRYDVASLLAHANSCRQKKLRRLPHIFAKVLELPFHSDADVSIDETPDSFRFTAATDDISGDVRVDAVEIYPGVTKIVIRGTASLTYREPTLSSICGGFACHLPLSRSSSLPITKAASWL